MEDNPRFLALSDKGLVQSYQAGDRAAYDEIYRRYTDRVRRTCARILPNPQDAEEATQEAFLRAYQALGRFNGSYQLGAWLARIAANVSIDLLRSRGRSAHLVGLPTEAELAETQRGPEELVAGGLPRVTETLEEIQPLHAQALHLRAVQGMSHDEMAGKLQMSPAQVKALLHRARRSFRRAWEKAEGWALAPLFLFRSHWQKSHAIHNAGASAANLAAFTAPGVPLLVEKAAATAVLVAVALSGMPSDPAAATVDGYAARPPVVASLESQRDETSGVETITTSGRAPRDALALALPDDVRKVVEQENPSLSDDDEPKRRKDDDGGFPFGPGSSDTKKTVKEVGKKLEDVGDVLP